MIYEFLKPAVELSGWLFIVSFFLLVSWSIFYFVYKEIVNWLFNLKFLKDIWRRATELEIIERQKKEVKK